VIRESALSLRVKTHELPTTAHRSLGWLDIRITTVSLAEISIRSNADPVLSIDPRGTLTTNSSHRKGGCGCDPIRGQVSEVPPL